MPTGEDNKPTSSGDIFQGLGGAPATAPAPAPATAPAAQPEEGDIFKGLGGTRPASSVSSSAPNDDIFSGLGGKPQTGAPQKYQTQDPNMPWYERAWDWANSPLINLNPENQGGFTGGVEDVASSLTSPLSIALTVGTFGGGAILRGLGLAAEETPLVLKGIKALVDVGFTAQGAVQAAKESPRVLDALKEGDYDTAKRLAVHVLAGG